ncbi:DUF2169 family type VI secretion system accessory protein [Enhygromyxa salina]|uniref:DUF2169 domain-containing protein n=1 Tax=Enhygromyxa salina TaxID=215803 RepID=A0A2S9Y0B8_9BACT|nr:DUF2169 domain-containing protein [Enhygromyxa salina]PRP98567.1 hypothetical protein ENSA7_65100 [Enhygromyxa salina]
MQIAANTTGMTAGMSVATDKHGHDYCVVVVKGTFDTDARGHMTLAGEQAPLILTDEHYGDPEISCIRYECEFAPEKPHAEVLVVGKAIPPGGRPASATTVRLDVEGCTKDIRVTGERRWVRSLGGVVPSAPVPFTEMLLTYDRAFGGQDDSRGQGAVAVEARNLHGVGYNPHRTVAQLDGSRLPNLERPDQPMTGPRDRLDPVGFGVLGRAYQQRLAYAGTYDQRWLDDVCPFLPEDFDARYFMSAPQDQWFPHFLGGERIRCVHMANEPVVQYVLPSMHVPIAFCFRDREIVQLGICDTVLVEPACHRAMLLWRTRVRLGKKLGDLRSVLVGPQPPKQAPLLGYRGGKPHFRTLGSALAWIRERSRTDQT